MFFKKSFSSTKCKTLLRLAISRLKLLRNSREVQLKKLKKELINLLKANQERSAHLKVEHIYKEQSILAAHEILGLMCQQIADQLPIIKAQKQCPIDLREAVATIIYAAPRCSDVEELKEIRRLLSAKYGKEFTTIAADLRPDCGVNRVVIEKLSLNRPSIGVKLKLMKDIATEYELDWDPSALKSQLLMPHEDLLEGPSQFVGASRMPSNRSYEEPTAYSPSSSQHNQSSVPVDTWKPTAPSLDFPAERQFIPFGRPPMVEVESPLSGSQEESAVERRKSFNKVVSAARKAAESAERAAAAARKAVAMVGGECGSSTDNESGSDGNEASQSCQSKVRRDPSNFGEAEEGRGGLHRKQASRNHPMATSISITRPYAEDDDEDEEDDAHSCSNSGWDSTSMLGMHGRTQLSSQGLNSRVPSSNALRYQQDNRFLNKGGLETPRAAPVFDTEDWDSGSNNENLDEAHPSIPVGPPTRGPPKLPEGKTPSLTKVVSFSHPKLPDCDEIEAHFRALKAMNSKKQ